MIRSFLGFSALATLTGLSAPVSAWEARNWLEVNPVGADRFEVIGRPGSAGPDFWCAAGEYAFLVLGAKGPDRIYLVRERGPSDTTPRLSAAHFALTPPVGDTSPKPPLLSLRAVGDNLSVSFARHFCTDRMDPQL